MFGRIRQTVEDATVAVTALVAVLRSLDARLARIERQTRRIADALDDQ